MYVWSLLLRLMLIFSYFTMSFCCDFSRCVLSNAQLVYSDKAYNSSPGFKYITGTAYYDQISFACEVPVTKIGAVRVSFSANQFTGNERAQDPNKGEEYNRYIQHMFSLIYF